MKIIYASEKLKTVCTSAKAARKFFGGNDALARSLMSRINAIAWRIILQPLNDNEEPYDSCNIDEIARFVRIVEITEVSRHYE